eukprot:g7210.t1
MHIYPKRAALEGLEIEMFKLVSYSATPEQWKEWLRVPLEHAAARGNLELVNKLLGAGTNGSAGRRGCRNRTLLDAAAVGGNEDVVSGLLQAGSQPDVKVVSCWSKRSALYTSIVLGHVATARRLALAGADVDFVDPVGRSAVLHEAVRGEHSQLVKELLMAGASMDVRDECAWTPLHMAAANGLAGIAFDLVPKGADKDARDERGVTPLMLTAQHGHLSAAKTLLASGASFRFQGWDDPHSALEWAAMGGHVGVLQAFLDHGADVNSRNHDGDTPLDLATKSNQAGAVAALIDAGADVDGHMCHFIPRLGWAAKYASRSTMLALLQRGANVNSRNEYGWTPLHWVCFEPEPGVLAAVDLLLRWGADETAVDVHGQTISEMPDVLQGEASADEIENVRLLLTRAPADRVWRRRGWLVVLRSRASKASTGGCPFDGRSDGRVDAPSISAGDREGDGCKVARRGESDTASKHARSAKDGTTEGVMDWAGLVALLLDLETEGVFRTVVGYL